MIDHTYVICAYNDSLYLESCIESLKAQTRQSNIILYTSTPSQYIEEICRRHQIPIFTAEGGSIGKDWNNALSFVQTQFVTIAHQDDIYTPTYGEEILSRVSEESLILFSDYREIRDDVISDLNSNLNIKTLMLKTLSIFPSLVPWRRLIIGLGNPICCPAVTYNLKKLEGFKFNEDMRVSLDWYAWYQILQEQGRFEFVSKRLMYHRIHEESETTNNIRSQNRTLEDFQMYSHFWPKWFAKILLKYYIKSQETNE